MSQQTYYDYLTDVVGSFSAINEDAKILIADSSYCQGKYSDNIRMANRKIIRENSRVLSGTDLDQYHNNIYRYDDCHLSETSLDRAANAWFKSLQPHF